MGEIIYRLANPSDVELMVSLRAAFLAEVHGSSDASDSTLIPNLRQYFSANLTSGQFIAYFAQAEGQIAGTGGIVYHHHPPTIRWPNGIEGYIMNMYTLPEYRGRGIATRLLKLLLDLARKSGCDLVNLHALPQGRSIYVKCGFEPDSSVMRMNFH